MAKKTVALSEYVSASSAAQILSAKHHRLISPKYIRKLAFSKKQAIRIERVGDRILYRKSDIEAATIKQKQKSRVH